MRKQKMTLVGSYPIPHQNVANPQQIGHILKSLQFSAKADTKKLMQRSNYTQKKACVNVPQQGKTFLSNLGFGAVLVYMVISIVAGVPSPAKRYVHTG